MSVPGLREWLHSQAILSLSFTEYVLKKLFFIRIVTVKLLELNFNV